jgi:nucleotide-binding universal stress UspA family protein
VKRVLVATDESATANKAVEWASEMAGRYGSELLIVHVMVPENLVGAPPDEATIRRERLQGLAERLAGPRGRARVLHDSDPADAIVRTAEEEAADVIVVGNLGMSERREFLLGNIPNRISHNARCSVMIVNTFGSSTARPGRQAASKAAAEPDAEPAPGQLMARAARIGRVMAAQGLKQLTAGRQRAKTRRPRRPPASERRWRSWDRPSPSWARSSRPGPTCCHRCSSKSSPRSRTTSRRSLRRRWWASWSRS